MSDATFSRTRSLLGERGVVDLTGFVGTDVTFSALVNAGEVPATRPAGSPDHLPVAPRRPR